MPFVDQEIIIQIETNAIIRLRREAIETGAERYPTRPANRKIIGWQIGRGGCITPVEVNITIIAHQGWIAVKLAIGPIFTFPIGETRWGYFNTLPPD